MDRQGEDGLCQASADRKVRVGAAAAENWLAQFETALAERDDGLLKALFHPDSHWRDVLALSWSLQTINGANAILTELKTHAHRAAPSAFQIDPDRAAPGDPRRRQYDRSDFQI